MNELTTSAILDMFSQIVTGSRVVRLGDRLGDVGWRELPSSRGGSRREWQNGEVLAIQFGHGEHAFLEATIEISWPDPDDLASEDRLTAGFESRFKANLAQARRLLGEAVFVGTYGDEGFPEDVDAVMIASWSMDSGMVSLNFKHEDSGLPFRITATCSLKVK